MASLLLLESAITSDRLREHDSANYGTGFAYRGNVTKSTQPCPVNHWTYDITGMVVTADDNCSHSVSVTPDSGKNYAVPSVITPNSEANRSTTQTYTSFLGLTSVTAPNQAINSYTYSAVGWLSSYDQFQRPAALNGATLTYDVAPGDTDYSRNAWGPVAMAQYAVSGGPHLDRLPRPEALEVELASEELGSRTALPR
jgi:hypothetical protein